MNNDAAAGGLSTRQALFQTPRNPLLSKEFCCPIESHMDPRISDVLKVSRLVISFSKHFSYHFLVFDNVTKPSHCGGGGGPKFSTGSGRASPGRPPPPTVEGPPCAIAPFPLSLPSLPSRIFDTHRHFPRQSVY